MGSDREPTIDLLNEYLVFVKIWLFSGKFFVSLCQSKFKQNKTGGPKEKFLRSFLSIINQFGRPSDEKTSPDFTTVRQLTDWNW